MINKHVVANIFKPRDKKIIKNNQTIIVMFKILKNFPGFPSIVLSTSSLITVI